MATTPVFLPGKSHRQMSLVSHSPGGHKESDVPEQLSTALPQLQSYKLTVCVICLLPFIYF